MNMTSGAGAQGQNDAGQRGDTPYGMASLPPLPTWCDGAVRFHPPGGTTTLPAMLPHALGHRLRQSIMPLRRLSAVTPQPAALSHAQRGRPRRRVLRRALAGVLLLCATQAVAEDALTARLTTFMQRQFSPAPLSLRVQVVTPAERRLTCAEPLFSLPSRTRVMGNLSLRMVCGGQTRFLQVVVQVTDRYLVAARPIAARQTLTDDDIDWRTGRLDLLPVPPLRDRSAASGSVSERIIGSGQPLTAAMLRRAWLIRSGQRVTVIAGGDGFALHSAGKALGNGAANDAIKVKMDSGQQVSGTVTTAGQVRVVL
ncbi:flagellar basal body P-ring formation chaperone FlgA [Sodalis praecaptivus]|uniref:flagellar basal body P-ring formation chaperone FlgA n=1 Tax=Sodalis praecaptivus TaxID=1239307 RepID=UPI00068791EA|nr:flagellar basal body P-ring formation chaperone FlgA [Sodalis praecaptivus]